MAGDINAIGILVVPLATALLLLRFGRLPKPPLTVLIAMALSALVAAVADMATSGRAIDLRGRAPTTQWLVPCICLALILAFVGPTWIRYWAAAGAVGAAFLLSHHYLYLGDTNAYTSDPGRVFLRKQALGRYCTLAIRHIASDTADADTTFYPRGWLSDSEIAEIYLNGHRDLVTIRALDVFPLWHTRITGLYRTEPKTLEIWYPGGTLKEALGRLEFRERKPASNP